MAKIKVEDMAKRLAFVQQWLMGQHPETGSHQWMAPNASKLKTTPNRLPENKGHNIKWLRTCAKQQLDSNPDGSSGNYSAIYNYNSLNRFAEMLSRLERGMKELEVTEMEKIYFDDQEPAERVVKADYKFISAKNPVYFGSLAELLNTLMDNQEAKAKAAAEKKKGGRGKKRDKKGKGKKRNQEPDEEEEVEESLDGETEAQSEVAAPAESKSWIPDFGASRFDLKKVGMIALLLVVLYLVLGTGLLGTITGMISGDGTTNQPVYTQVDPNAQQPAYTVNPDGTITWPDGVVGTNPGVELTPEARSLQDSVRTVGALLKEGVLVAMLLMNLGALLLVAFDRAADFEIEDFYAFLAAMVAYIVLVLLTDGSILINGKEYSVDLALTIVLAGALGLIAWLGNRDFTVVSVGMFIAGNILFMTNTQAFAVLQPPEVAVQAWTIGALAHLMEMIRQEDTRMALLVGFGGIALQAGLFFFALAKLSTAADPFIVNNLQVIAFVLAMVGTFIAIVGLMFTGLKTSVFRNVNGIQNIIDTSMFDAAVIANCYGALALMLYIW